MLSENNFMVKCIKTQKEQNIKKKSLVEIIPSLRVSFRYDSENVKINSTIFTPLKDIDSIFSKNFYIVQITLHKYVNTYISSIHMSSGN